MLFIARGDRPEVFEFVEEVLDQVAVSIDEGAEGRRRFAVGHRLDISPRAACRHSVPCQMLARSRELQRQTLLWVKTGP